MMTEKHSFKRVTISADPSEKDGYIFSAPSWPAWWVKGTDWDGMSPIVWCFRRTVTITEAATYRIHVSADQRYDIFLNGERMGWGAERGDLACWFYDTYELTLAPGEHTLAVRVWWAGKGVLAPYAHMTEEPAMILYGEGEAANALFSTGVAEWEVLTVRGIEFVPPQIRDSFCVSGGRVVVDGNAFPWGCECGDAIERGDAADGWAPAITYLKGALRTQGNEAIYQWWLKHAILPPMYEAAHTHFAVRWCGAKFDEAAPLNPADSLAEEAAAWQRLLDGGSAASGKTEALTVPANTARYVLLDMEQYVCGFATLQCSGGKNAVVEVAWAESLFTNATGFDKDNRGEVDGKYFRGLYDTFVADGGAARVFEPLWWTSGRYIMLRVTTQDEPLTLEKFAVRETHYPYAFRSEFTLSDTRWDSVVPIAKRVLEMCSHESYMDCPYYEQLMYVGDTRLEVLTTYALTADNRLPQKAVWMFDLSRREPGFTASRYPSREKQVIPPFSMWWVMMVYDAMMWRDDFDFVAKRMNGVRAVLEAFRACVKDDGLMYAPKGWNFVDWPGWDKGMPPGAESSANATLNFQASWVFRAAAELEDLMGEPLLAQRNREMSANLARAAEDAFWDDARGLFAEDLAHTAFAEHAQCMAALCGHLDAKAPQFLRTMISDANADITRTTIYFSFYMYEVFTKFGMLADVYDRFEMWFGLHARGFKTTPEKPEPTRSDCHAWGAHPLFHIYAGVCGIRPAAPGFERVRIAPQPCGNTALKANMVHPKGEIAVDLTKNCGTEWCGTVSVPDGIACEIILPEGSRHTFVGGEKVV